MFRSRKFIIIGVLATALIISACIGGVALAQSGGGSDNQSQSRFETLLSKVCEIYQAKTGVAIDQAALRDAFTQAEKEMRTEALQDYLQNLVEQGKITQEQADEYLKWWQAKPDMEQYRQQLEEWLKTRPDIPSEFKEWREAMPDIPLPGPFGGFGGMGRIRGWGRLCPPIK